MLQAQKKAEDWRSFIFKLQRCNVFYVCYCCNQTFNLEKIISEDKTRLVRAYSRTSDIDCDFLGVSYTNTQTHSIYYNTHFTLNQNYDIYPRLNSQ